MRDGRLAGRVSWGGEEGGVSWCSSAVVDVGRRPTFFCEIVGRKLVREEQMSRESVSRRETETRSMNFARYHSDGDDSGGVNLSIISASDKFRGGL